MNLFLYYVIAINLYGLILMYIDKEKSKNKKWRISERTLFLTAIALGSIGILSGMYLFRHKTRHTKFVLGIPMILIVQLIFAAYLTSKYFNISLFLINS